MLKKHWQSIVIVALVGFTVFQYVWDIEQTALLKQQTPQHESVNARTPVHLPGTLKEQQSGRSAFSRISGIIISEEGVSFEPYEKKGIVHIGVGRSLQTNGISISELFAIVSEPDLRYVMERATISRGRIKIDSLEVAHRVFPHPLTEHDLELLLTDDLKNVKSEAVRVFGDHWHQIDTVRQEAIIDILFNLGLPHFLGFVNFIDAVKIQDWKTAASELLLSEAARQNYSRYNHVALVIDTGDEKYFNLSKK